MKIVGSSQPIAFDDYLTQIGDTDRVINMLVGGTQRIQVYADRGFAVPQPIPEPVAAAYATLISAGYTQRMVS